ncbi:MAG: SDR family oxidoreductase [Gemmatimonadota bacterium]
MPTDPGRATSRTYLLTGVTGFLGKVVLEQLLRRREELRVERVYLLIRPSGPRSAQERFRREVACSDCFSRLPAGWTASVEVAEGALEEPGLGLDPAVREELVGRVTHILHAAASVNFDLPLAEAARANVATSLNLLETARRCPRLEKLVYVSTAYVTPHRGEGRPIEETLAPLPRPAAEIYRSILDGSANGAHLLAQSGHPNTYLLTKCLAEHLLVENRGDVPLAIVRPSIISASWRHPFPGWIDSTAGFAAFVVLLGLGHLRAMVGSRDGRADLIPVDEVAARVLLASESTRPAGAQPAILHAVAGLERSPRLQDCWDKIQEFFSVHRVDRRPALRYLGPPGLRFALADALWHRLPMAGEKLRSRRAGRPGARRRTRLAYVNSAFSYFGCNSFAFRSSLPLDGSFDPRTYITTVCRGVYRHILGREETEWTLAGRRHPGHGSDLRWVCRQPHGTAMIRFASWMVTKVLRRCVEAVTVDIPSFEAARLAAPDGSPLVIVPTHRSYLDFVLCSYVFFARRDLGIPIPQVAAATDFARIPVLGRLFGSLQAFYLRRGVGREDPELTRRVHTLVREGRVIECFIEGQRSRSREFLPPKRGLLRCLQATGETCTLLPVAISYDRVPEEAVFARELAGAPKVKMRLGPLLAWTLRACRGRIALGRIHIACGTPVRLGPECDVHAVSHEVIRRLQCATVSTTYHLQGFLDRHPIDGVDVAWLRSAIEQRGGRVLESDLRPPEDLDPLIAATLRHQFAHLFEDEDASDEPLRRFLHALFGRSAGRAPETEPVA